MSFNLDFGRSRRATTSSSPMVQRARVLILKLIRDSDMTSGDRIPSERELAERFRISRMTVRKALSQLVKESELERRGTSGTFIPELAVVRPLSRRISTAISEVLESGGRHSGSRLLFFEQIAADANISRHLELDEGDDVISIKRLRSANEVPFCVETSYLPSIRVPGLVAADVVDTPSLYSYLRNRYQLTFANSDFHVSVRDAPKAEAELLNLAVGASTLCINMTVYDNDGKPVEYLISHNHPDLVALESLREDTGQFKSVYTDWSEYRQH